MAEKAVRISPKDKTKYRSVRDDTTVPRWVSGSCANIASCSRPL